MLRRVSPILRRMLALVGLASLVWIVLSLFCRVSVCYYDHRDFEIRVQDGAVLLYCLYPPPLGANNLFETRPGSLSTPPPGWYNYVWTDAFDEDSRWSRLSGVALPAFQRGSWGAWREVNITLPLWLLAVLCLAWPVSSFLLHRRRQRRGFAVHPAPPLPPGEGAGAAGG